MKAVWLFGMVVPVLALAAVSVISTPTKPIYNGSESAPTGFYWIDQQTIDRNDFVLIHAPEHIRKMVERRQYLPPDIPLIKRVVGIEGDTICRRKLEIIVDSVTVVLARKRDRHGRPLPDWQGCIRLKANELFLLQVHPESFDSRYFGPVDRSLVIGKATKLRFP